MKGGVGKVGVELQRAIKVLPGPSELPAFDQRQRSVVMTPGALGRECQADRERGSGFFMSAERVRASAFMERGPEVVWTQFEGVVELSRSASEVAAVEQRAPERGRCPGPVTRG